MSGIDQKLTQLYAQLRELYLLGCIGGLLNWDQSVNMPPAGAECRAEQEELVSRLKHQRGTSSAFVALVEELYDQINQLRPDDQVNIRELKRTVDRLRKLPESFVAEKARLAAISYSAWVEARPKDDFAAVQPHLTRLVALARQEAELVGFAAHPYDALLDEYEPGLQLAEIKPLLLRLAEGLAPLVPPLHERFAKVPKISGSYPAAQQEVLCRAILQDMSYSFQSGRLDSTAHPFASELGPRDVRVTTRYDESDPISAVLTVIHEVGHAFYDLGLPERWRGTPRGAAVSLGVHESLSRLWENIIGRGRPFVSYLHRKLAEHLPAFAKEHSPDGLWQQINRVERSLIRVEADEVTYSIHVVIRMLLEEALVEGSLEVSDLPSAWNEYYRRYLGVEVPSYRDGVMQDVHWYGGSFGYFPCYALGNIFNASYIGAIRREIPDLDAQVERGEFKPLRGWLDRAIHEKGQLLRGKPLVESLSGEPLSEAPFLEYVKHKFAPL